MEEAFATRKLIQPAELKALNTKSNLRGGLQMASHLGLIASLAAGEVISHIGARPQADVAAMIAAEKL